MSTSRSVALSPGIAAVRRRAAGRRDPLVLIDGPSGAGKTTFAAALADAWPGPVPRILRVDEAVPGWDGLQRGAERLGRTLTGPHARGAMGVVHRWDWLADRPGERHRLPPGQPLVVEGCGAFLVGAKRPDTIRVWLHAPYATRRRRALDRDRGAFDPHWEAWEADWRRHVDRTRSDRSPAIRVRLAD